MRQYVEAIIHEEKVREKSLLLKCHINLLVSHCFRKITGGNFCSLNFWVAVANYNELLIKLAIFYNWYDSSTSPLFSVFRLITKSANCWIWLFIQTWCYYVSTATTSFHTTDSVDTLFLLTVLKAFRNSHEFIIAKRTMSFI